MTTLTSEQHQAVEQAGDQPVPVVDPQTQVGYFAVRADLFQERGDIPSSSSREKTSIGGAGSSTAATSR